jgi:hypothetical protein
MEFQDQYNIIGEIDFHLAGDICIIHGNTTSRFRAWSLAAGGGPCSVRGMQPYGSALTTASVVQSRCSDPRASTSNKVGFHPARCGLQQEAASYHHRIMTQQHSVGMHSYIHARGIHERIMTSRRHVSRAAPNCTLWCTKSSSSPNLADTTDKSNLRHQDDVIQAKPTYIRSTCIYMHHVQASRIPCKQAHEGICKIKHIHVYPPWNDMILQRADRSRASA